MKFISKLILICLILSCNSTSLLNKKQLTDLTRKSLDEIMSTDSEYGASIIHDNQSVKISFEGNELFTYFTSEKYILYINDKGEKYTNQKFTYSTSQYDINSVDVITIKNDGTEIVQTDENIKRSYLKNNRGDELLQIEFNFPNVVPGDIMYYKIKRSTKKQYYYNINWDVDYKVPVLNSRFVFITPRQMSDANSQVGYNMFTQNIKVPKAKIEQSLATQSNYFTYEINNIMPIKRKPYSLPDNVTRRIIEFYFKNDVDKNWQSILFTNPASQSSINYAKYFDSNSEIKDLVNQKFSDKKLSEKELLDSVKNYLSNTYKIKKNEHIFSFGNVKPNEAFVTIGKKDEEVTLKDLNILFVSILREMGFEAFLTYNKSYSSGEFFKPKNDIFDLDECHTYIKGKDNNYWVDLSRSYFKVGEIYYDNQLTDGFLINDSKNTLSPITLPSTNYRFNKRQKNFEASLDKEDMSISGVFSVRYYGNLSHYVRYKEHSLTSTEFQSFLKDEIAKYIDFNEINDITYSKFDPEQNFLEIKASVKLINKLQKIGNNTVIQPYLFKQSKFLNAINDIDRTEDFYFDIAYTDADRITITIPKDFEINADRLKIENNNQLIKYDYSNLISNSENKINLFMLTQIKSETISASNIKLLVSIRDALNKIQNEKIRLTAND